MGEKVWEKSPQELIDIFYEIMSLFPEAELRKMFGYPCAFINGNMFVGLHQRDLIVRFSMGDRESILNQNEGAIFAPMKGRIMKEYVAISEEIIYKRRNRLNDLIAVSLDYVKTLPIKSVKKKGVAV